MKIKEILRKILRRLSITPPQRDYYRDWISDEGKIYRQKVCERQKKDGSKPLVANPTMDEIRMEIAKYNPSSVLEIGCGWGRLMEGLTNDFNIEGCDCSTDMMKMAGSNLKIFCWDIVKEGCPKELAKWDVLFCRGVFSSIVENKARLKKSIENTLNVTKKALIIWEWPEVLEKIRVVSTDERLILKPIEHLDE